MAQGEKRSPGIEMTPGNEMTLADASDGQWLVVEGTSDDEVMWQALRFGIGVGSLIQVQQNIPHGPVIVCKKHVEIAIGRQLAKSVNVKPADNFPSP